METLFDSGGGNQLSGVLLEVETTHYATYHATATAGMRWPFSYLTMTLEQAYSKARPGLRYRMEQSVALLRKAERLARLYDPEEGFYLAFSGGKDSQALYHIAELAGVPFKAHFSPTTVDPPQLIKFIKKSYPDVEFGKVDKSMYQVAKEMGMVPTMKIRWCCAKFKESAGAGKVTLTGVRHAESVRRAQRKEVEVSGHKFSGNIDEFSLWSETQIKKKYKNINQDEFSRDKEQEVRCINGKDSIIVNPLIEWTDADVWDFLNKVVEVPHCELYDPPYNRHRIGCILCPMSSYKTKLRDIELYPYVKKKWLEVFEYFIGGGGTTPIISGENGSNPRVVFTTRGGQPTTNTSGISRRRWAYNHTAATLQRKSKRNLHPPPVTRNGKPRWGEAGVSLYAQVLFDWWLTHESWESFKAKLEHPSLFETYEDDE